MREAPGIPRLVPGWWTFLQIWMNSKLLPGCCHALLHTTPHLFSHYEVDRQHGIVTVLVGQTIDAGGHSSMKSPNKLTFDWQMFSEQRGCEKQLDGQVGGCMGGWVTV